MKIYTRTGDKGQTGYTGGRVSKSDPMINLVGELDELNAVLGWTAVAAEPELVQLVQAIQSAVFAAGAVVADPQLKLPDASGSEAAFEAGVTDLEGRIDSFDSQLPPLHNFILAGGVDRAARLHIARTVCRRVERTAVAYTDAQAGDYAEVLRSICIYLNRVSDLLFVLARYANTQSGVEDIVWKR